jgi:ABC-type Fe3+ transport system permease subunit
MMGSTLGLAWVAGMTLALVELDVTLLTYPPGMETAQVRIFNMVHYARDAEVSALCLLVTALGLLPAIFHVLLSGGGGGTS